MENKEKIIWLDGHTTTISSEEVLEKHYEVYTESGIDKYHYTVKLED